MRIILILLLISAPLFSAERYSQETRDLLEKLELDIQSILLSISESEKRAGNDIKDFSFNLEISPQQSIRLGMVLDPERLIGGVKVVSVSPGGLGDRLGIKSNDRITNINNVEITPENIRDVLNDLRRLAVGEKLSMSFKRGGELKHINSIVEGQYLPSIKLSIGTEEEEIKEDFIEENLTANDSSSDQCGKVSVFFKPPLSMRLQMAYFTHIDDEQVFERMSSYRLPIGKHKVKLQLLVRDSFISGRSMRRQDVPPVTLNIEANKSYYFAAKFDDEQKSWEAIVWKVSDVQCEL